MGMGGMGMGSMGGMGMGGMGMGMGMGGMGLMGMGGMGSHLGWIYSLQSAMYSLGALMEFAGMATQGVMHLFRQLYYKFHQFRYLVMHSETRKWTQRKCKKSRILRWVLMFVAMTLTHQAIRLVKHLLHLQQHGHLLEGLFGGGTGASSFHGQRDSTASANVGYDTSPWHGEFASHLQPQPQPLPRPLPAP
jgi:hypothetical protein